ncbi:hypothetical protein [Leucobacter chironomi]|uniref:hypothetical protein n=1 Tax=Leucobacter chironomi TaxID=491918 RepID=UPI00040C9062|nr:hypothetical protein [Leucobacter chironomi]
MTIKLRARVRRVRPSLWAAEFGPVPGYTLLPLFAFTWVEALMLAYERLDMLDRKLMDEVHESSANRRAERCGGCRDLGPHRNVPDCQHYVPEAP